MNNVKRTILMAAGAVVAAVAVAGPASASAATQTVRPIIFPVTATTHVLTQALGNGGIWATESVRRTGTVSGGAPVPASFCGTGATRCFAYSAIVQDHGTFRAYRFALTPNQFHPGRHIRSSVTGRVDGVTSFATFFASTAPHAFFVPRFFSGPFFATASWPKVFFPTGTRFSTLHISSYRVTYSAWTRCGPQRWTDASWNGHGDLPFDGNIRGC
jgi:hypothetical protein